MTAIEYRKLCKEIHRKYGKPMNRGYWESCACADDVYRGSMSRERLFELLDEALIDE